MEVFQDSQTILDDAIVAGAGVITHLSKLQTGHHLEQTLM